MNQNNKMYKEIDILEMVELCNSRSEKAIRIIDELENKYITIKALLIVLFSIEILWLIIISTRIW